MKISPYLTFIFFLLLSTSGFAQSSSDNLQVSLEYLQRTGKYVSGDLDGLTIANEHVSAQNGVTHLYLKQHYKGIPIVNAITTINIRDGAVTWNAGDLITSIEEKVNTLEPTLPSVQALQKVMQTHKLAGALPTAAKSVSSAAERKTVYPKGDIALEDISVQLALFPSEGALRLSWQVEIFEKSKEHLWNSYIDAQTGAMIGEFDFAFDSRCHSKEVHAAGEVCSHAMQDFKNCVARFKTEKQAKISIVENALMTNESYNVFALPVESPNHGSRSLVVAPWLSASDAGTLGWHNDGTNTYTVTRGNNVDLFSDFDGSNFPTNGDNDRVEGGANLEFDFPIDFSQEPTSNPNPYLTNLFYWTNLSHDVFYQYGFDEPSGNFQNDNLGRGGFGGDRLEVHALDGGVNNNANFIARVEGISPFIQMGLFDPPLIPSPVDSAIINSPIELERSVRIRYADFGDTLQNPLTADVVRVDDGSANPHEGFGPLINDLTGKIAIINRGNCVTTPGNENCMFLTRCLNAQNAGAVGVIVANIFNGSIVMQAAPDEDDASLLTIPCVMMGINRSNDIIEGLEAGNTVNVTIRPKLTDLELNPEPDPKFDSGMDNVITVHEYAHGISLRLTGGPGTISCLSNFEQPGEGWSDFFGIWMTMESNDQHTDLRPIGTYVSGETVDGPGVRPAPYTTDFTINNLTYGSTNSTQLTVPHGVGTVWGSMLWDLNWAMINAHGYSSDLYTGSGGNNMTMQLVMDGLKNQACKPGFVDARDAIIQADVDNYGGANADIIWNVFARRGLGFSANQGNSLSRFDQTEAFDLPAGVPALTDFELFESSILPVEFTGIHAVPNNKEKTIELYWSTAREVNNAGYSIQRRSDSATDFVTIDFTEGRMHSDTPQDYTFTDDEVSPGLNYYYRLAQTDVDGTLNYSEVVSARLSRESSAVRIFPNPTSGTTHIQLPEALQGLVNLQVFNASGQLLAQQTVEALGNTTLELDIMNNPQGVYFLHIKTGQGNFIERIYLNKK